MNEVSVLGRNTQGVRLIKLRDEEMLNSVSRIEEQEDPSQDDGDDAPYEVRLSGLARAKSRSGSFERFKANNWSIETHGKNP